MRIKFCAPFDQDRMVDVTLPPGQTLGQLLAPQATSIKGVLVNGQFLGDWHSYMPQDRDTLTVFGTTGEPATLTLILTAVAVALVSTAVSIGLQYLIRALTPGQAKPGDAGKPEQAYGIAGLTNTTAYGTPKFMVFGTRRIYGHIVTTRVEVAGDGRGMRFGIGYFMGEGPISAFIDVQINDISHFYYNPPISAITYLGDGDISLPLPFFPTISQVWGDGRQLPEGESLIFQTRSISTERVVLIFTAPLLYGLSGSIHVDGNLHFTIEYQDVGGGGYVEAPGSPYIWVAHHETTGFTSFLIEFDHPDQWRIRVTCTDTGGNVQGTAPFWHSTMEEQTGEVREPTTSALLFLEGIASSQIQSFEGMRVSALVDGLTVPVWDGLAFTEQWTANRAWIVRFLLTDERIGLGHRISASLFDDDAALEVASYWDEAVHGTTRDRCDVLVNDRRAAWDWIKTILQEGRAALIPSGGLLKLVVDRAAAPNLLYSTPGNILEGSVTSRQGDGEGPPPNTLRGQFPDSQENEKVSILEVVADGSESEPQREELLTIVTLKNVAHVYWYLRALLLRKRLVARGFTWQSPATALVSEPMDVVSLAHTTADLARGTSGFFSSGSTGSRLLLDRLVTLVPSTTYTFIVRTQADNTMEYTTVTTGAGTWGAIVPTTPLATTPAEGDLWAIGAQDVAILPLLVERVEGSADGIYTLSASEYRSELYEFPEPPTSVAAVVTKPPA